MGHSSAAAIPSARSRLGHPLLWWAVAVLLIVAGALSFALWPEDGAGPASGDVRVIARGDAVQVEQHLVAGKYTLIDFYADWCESCQRLDPFFGELAARRADLAVRKVNVVSWESPVAKQYGITALPRLLLYGPRGEFIAEGDAVLNELGRLFS